MEKTLSAVQARNEFEDLLEDVFHRSHSVIIERDGQAIAVLVPPEQYRRWQEQRAAFFSMVDEMRQRTGQLAPDELEGIIAEAVAAARTDEASSGLR